MAQSKEIYLNVQLSKWEQESIKITIDAEDEEKIKSLKWHKLSKRDSSPGVFSIITFLNWRPVPLYCILLGKKVRVRRRNGDRTDFRKENLEAYGPEKSIYNRGSGRNVPKNTSAIESEQIATVIQDPADWRMTDWSDFRSEKWEFDGSPFADSVKQDPPAQIKQNPSTPTKQDHSIQEPKICGFSPAIAEIISSPTEVGADSDAMEEHRKAKLKRKYGPADGNGFLDLEVVVDHLRLRKPGEAQESDIKGLINAGLSIASREDY